jgi:hypothetical protein
MKYIKKLKIDIFSFINASFFNDEIEINEINLNLFESNEYSYKRLKNHDDFRKEYKLIKENSEIFKNFINKYTNDDFPNIGKYDYYYDLISTQYLKSILEKNEIDIYDNRIYDIKNKDILNLILKSSEYCYELLEHDNFIPENIKEKIEQTISKNNFWGYKYSVKILNSRWDKLEESKNFKNDQVVIYYYFLELIIEKELLKDDSDEIEFFNKYIKDDVLKYGLSRFLKESPIIRILEYFKCAYIPKLHQFLVKERPNDYIKTYINLINDFSDLQPAIISNNTEKPSKTTSRMKEYIFNDPKLVIDYINHSYEHFSDFIEENEDQLKKTMIKDPESLIYFLKHYYLHNHDKIVKKFPEAIKAILDTNNSKIVFQYIEIMNREENIKNNKHLDEDKIKDFIEVIKKDPYLYIKYNEMIKRKIREYE